jgi:hypothetical protein
VNANRLGHERLITALRGDSQVLDVANGMVTLDLFSVASMALERLDIAAPGLVPRSGRLQDSASRQSTDSGRQDLARRLGLEIPPDFGEVPLFPVTQLEAVQRWLRLLDAAAIGLSIAAVALIIATMLVAGDRWQAVLALAIGTAAAFLLAWVLIPAGIGIAGTQISGPVARDVVVATLETLLDSLAMLLMLGVIVSAIVAIAAIFMVWSNRSERQRSTRQAGLATTP